jgi:uncharacterized short protein YbdD (DUF466 family)
MRFFVLSGASARALATSKDLLTRARTAVKRIAGMPNYEAYLEHLRSCHPECPLPSEREYYELYLKQRYAGGGMRCC